MALRIHFWMLLLLLPAWAKAEMAWLSLQVSKLDEKSALIQSFEFKKQSWIYDQALALMAFTHKGDLETAKRLAQALAQLQNPDGTWYFSYYLDGKSPHPEEGDMRPHGAISWATIALLYYQKISSDVTFEKNWKLSLKLLSANLVSVSGFAGRGLRFSVVDNSATVWDERDLIALEHVVDAVAAFRLAYKQTGESRYLQHQMELEQFALNLWHEEKGHFWSGVTIAAAKINKDEYYQDNQSWTALALSHLGLKEIFAPALLSSCALLVKEDKKIGFTESKKKLKDSPFIWSEGTAVQALALNLFELECPEVNGTRYMQTLESMRVNGGVLYADRPNIQDFAMSPSVAGTVWTLFLKEKINPFDM